MTPVDRARVGGAQAAGAQPAAPPPAGAQPAAPPPAGALPAGAPPDWARAPAWEAEAARFDDEPDHGLTDPAVRAAWAELLLPRLPGPPAVVADLGCGTGTLARLMLDAGHRVLAADFAPAMIARAGAKLGPGHCVVADAARPPLADETLDAVVVRHVTWALPDPAGAVATWLRLLRPGGRLLLVEGCWHTGGGLRAADLLPVLALTATRVEYVVLDDPAYWGGPIADERYLLAARRPL